MLTATGEKLGEQIHDVGANLAGFRLEAAERLGALDKALEGFRNKVDTHLPFIKWIGVFFAGILVAVVFGAGRVVWDAATVSSDVKQQGRVLDTLNAEVKQQGTRLDTLNAEVKQQGTRLDRIEGRLDAIAKQLETLVNRSAPKAGG